MRLTFLLLVACGTGNRPQITQSDADAVALQEELAAVQEELETVQQELLALQDQQTNVSDLALEQSAQRDEVITLSDELSEAQSQIATLEEIGGYIGAGHRRRGGFAAVCDGLSCREPNQNRRGQCIDSIWQWLHR